jgi:hypothetical protein
MKTKPGSAEVSTPVCGCTIDSSGRRWGFAPLCPVHGNGAMRMSLTRTAGGEVGIESSP